MSTECETICEERRGRMRMKIIRKLGQYGPRYSAIVYRPYKKEENENCDPIWEETHWLDEQDILNSRRLHEVADDFIAESKRRDSFQQPKEAA